MPPHTASNKNLCYFLVHAGYHIRSIRYVRPKILYSKEESLSSAKHQHNVLYPIVVYAGREGKRVVSKVRMGYCF